MKKKPAVSKARLLRVTFVVNRQELDQLKKMAGYETMSNYIRRALFQRKEK
jgi:hypothetical protein